MKYKQFLLILVLSGLASTSFSHNTNTPDSNEAPLTIPSQKLEKIAISTEEAFYIFSECKQFAVDDEIEAEYVDDYVELCSYELTQAVKTAKYRLQENNTKVTPLKNKQSDTPRAL